MILIKWSIMQKRRRIMMMLLIGSVRVGLISMVPNLGPIIVVMGIMGWFNLSLDMFTMLIASIAIGLAVDDTIHFMYNFKRYYAETGDAGDEDVVHGGAVGACDLLDLVERFAGQLGSAL